MRSVSRVVVRTGVVGVLAGAGLFAGQVSAGATGNATPAAPAKLSAVGRTHSAHFARAVVRWHESSKNLRGVTVYRNTSDSRKGATRVVRYSRHHSYTDSSVKPGHTYWYFLRAYNTSGHASAYSVLPVVTSRSSTDRVLAGRVTDGTGAALHGVQVSVTNGTKHGYTPRTGTTGLFAQHRIGNTRSRVAACFRPSGTKQGGAYKYGYLAGCAHSGHVYTAGTRTHWKIAPGHFRSLDVALKAAAGVSGVIRGGKARVELIGDTDDGFNPVAQTTVAADGSYAFTGVQPAGDGYQVVALSGTSARASQIWNGRKHPSHYFDGNTAYTGDPNGLEGGQSFSAVAARNTADVTLTMPLWGHVAGTVTNADLSTVRVDLFDEDGYFSRSVHPTSSGTFTFPQVPPGDFTVCLIGRTASHKRTPGFCWDGSSNTQVKGYAGDGQPGDDDALDTISTDWGKTRSGLNFHLSHS